MAKNVLKTVTVHKAKDGDLSDGAGLMVKIKDGRARAAFRFTSLAGQRREMGLGLFHRNDLATTGISPTMARDAAGKARKLLADGVDPIEHKVEERERAKAEIAAKKAKLNAESVTLPRRSRVSRARDRTDQIGAAREALDRLVRESCSARSVERFDRRHRRANTARSTLESAALDDVGKHVPETLQRVRQRLDAVWEDAISYKRATINPAMAIRRKMREQAPRRERGSFRALPYVELPAFVRELRRQDGVAARALEFALPTGSRTGEVLGAVWEEFDLDARVWTVPAARMKGHEAHVVHLGDEALMALAAVTGLDARIVFPSPMRGEPRPLSNMALLTTFQRMKWDAKTTVHGLCRSTLSTWANETGATRPDVIEACLAHREPDKVKAAYNRAQFLGERRALLDAWADFCTGKTPASNVVAITAKAA